MSFRQSGFGAFGSFLFWTLGSIFLAYVPYGLGALFPLMGILATVGDIEKTTTVNATFGAFVSMLLYAAVGDKTGMALYILAVIVGFASLLKR